jgi:O-antigen/teichoic acid export membrane protein
MKYSFKDVLFKNNSTKQTVFKNTFWLYFGFGISSLVNFILIVYITRVLGASEFGRYAFASAFTSLFAVFSDLGLSTIITREFSGEVERLERFYSIISLKFVLGLVALSLTTLGSFFITQDNGIREIIFILAIFTFVSVFIELSYLFFRARQRMEHQAWIQSIVSLLTLVCAVIFLSFIASAKSASFAYLTASLLGIGVVAIFFHFKVLPLKIVWDRQTWKAFLLMSWPLAFAGIFGTIYNSIDSAMLGYVGQITETGWYNAAYRISRSSFMLAALVFSSIFPVLASAYKESKEKLQRVWDFQMSVVFVISLPLVMGGIILAPKLIEFAYGKGFGPSILTLQILMVMTGIILIYNNFNSALIITNHQKKFFWAALSGAIINVILNLILIPKYSLYGAAIATVFTHFIIFLLLMFFVYKYTSIKIFNFNILIVFAGVILATAIMVLVVTRPLIYSSTVLISIPIGILSYFIVLLILKKIWKQLIPAGSVKTRI